ncbi:MAG: fimbrillin family protein [Bacteroidales bacterium]|nr:fimbrillin family protein [Bacteroidales bacterium]
MTAPFDTNDSPSSRPEVISYPKATATAPAPVPGPVQLTFEHLLSRVMFQVHNYFPDGAAAKITVTDLKIVGAVSQATLTPAATGRAWAPVAGQVADVEFETSKLIDIPAGKGVAATEHQYMIPAALTKVTFKVKLDQAGVENEYDHEIELSGENVDQNAFLAINRSLRINIVLKPENIDPENALYPIEFTADVLAWN